MSEISGVGTLHRLIYVSHQKVQPSDLDDAVHDIIGTSIRNNRAVGISGLLLVHGGRFMQALEGAARAVMNTYRIIVGDRRHADAKVLIAGPVLRREFAEWSMCARRLSVTDDAILDTLAQRDVFHPEALSEAGGLQLLTAVRGIKARERHTLI